MLRKLSASILAVMLAVAGIIMPCARADTSGYAFSSTPLNYSTDNKIDNIELAAEAIDGYSMSYGQTFSFNSVVGPRDSSLGYVAAPNGRGANVVGGGVAQAATTLYMALLQLDDITFEEIYFYGDRFADDYVNSGYDAIMTDYNDEYDFRFTSYYDGVLTLSLWVEEDSVNCFISLDSDGGGMVGKAATPMYGGEGNVHNISLASDSIYGYTLYPYEEFSFNGTVGPRTQQAGYVTGINGRGAKVRGGGVAQVASTIYIALKQAPNVYVSEHHTYGDNFSEEYVSDLDEAILTDYESDKDFCFVYTGEGTLTIYTYISGDYAMCELYENEY